MVANLNIENKQKIRSSKVLTRQNSVNLSVKDKKEPHYYYAIQKKSKF
jgi:hypothetical protein